VFRVAAVGIAAVFLTSGLAGQQPADADRKVAGGGVTVKNWQGNADAGKQGLTVNDSKCAPEGNAFGPDDSGWLVLERGEHGHGGLTRQGDLHRGEAYP
jgi:hypothetical protein